MSEIFQGKVEVQDTSGASTRITLDGDGGDISVGGSGKNCTLSLLNQADKEIARIGGLAGQLLLRDDKGTETIHLNGDSGEVTVHDFFHLLDGVVRIGKGAEAIHLNGSGGGITVHDFFHVVDGALRIGAGGKNGVFTVKDKNGSEVFRVDAANGQISVSDSFRFVDGSLRLGAGGHDGTLLLRNADGIETIRMDGKAGDVSLAHADCAEDWDLADGELSVPGAVMVLDEQGALRQCRREYDTAVAGVISGAGRFKPGIVLDRRDSGRPRAPLAMMGKVFCQVDASFGAIRAGMLLTTSPRPGHAMAADRAKAFGAVLGKALQPFPEGSGLVPVMVSLQ
ncbi:MAG TPA: hypothetical protein VHC97_27600 [Thermoanaerobaculia bacterium]|jgi:hypothetical protein|nr:hypothetical protein [Thermoanaerobaculia bacterium]